MASGGELALDQFITKWGVVPADLVAAWNHGDYLSRETATLVTSQFLHGSWLHLLGNMLYLWIFGNNVEDRFGRLGFLAFYLFGGALAGLSQVAIDPTSTVPTIGASGAIAATLGAYFVLFPRARVTSLVFLGFFYQLIDVPAIIVLGFWFVLQLIDGLTQLGAIQAGGGVAFYAHIGGFVVGRGAGPPGGRGRGPDAPVGDTTGRGIIRRMDDGLVEMVVESVRVHMLSSRHVVILKEVARDRYLPIWIGPWEASAIAMKLQGLTPERPLTHDLFATTLEELGARIDRVIISELADETFHARVLIQSDGKTVEVDARPSDALALAVRTGVRIFAAEAVLEQAALGGDAGIADDEEGSAGSTLEATGENIVDPRLDVFRDFVNSLDVDAEGESRSS